MWPDQVSSPGPLTYESDALPTVQRGPAHKVVLKALWKGKLTLIKKYPQSLDSQYKKQSYIDNIRSSSLVMDKTMFSNSSNPVFHYQVAWLLPEHSSIVLFLILPT